MPVVDDVRNNPADVDDVDEAEIGKFMTNSEASQYFKEYS